MRTYIGEIIRPIGVAYVKCACKHQHFCSKLDIIKKEVNNIWKKLGERNKIRTILIVNTYKQNARNSTNY